MSTRQRGRDSAERLVQKQREVDAEPKGATQRLCRARRACVIHAEATGVTQRSSEAAQSLTRLTQRPAGLMLSFKLCWRGISWSRLSEYLFPKRGIAARFFSLSG